MEGYIFYILYVNSTLVQFREPLLESKGLSEKSFIVVVKRHICRFTTTINPYLLVRGCPKVLFGQPLGGSSQLSFEKKLFLFAPLILLVEIYRKVRGRNQDRRTGWMADPLLAFEAIRDLRAAQDAAI